MDRRVVKFCKRCDRRAVVLPGETRCPSCRGELVESHISPLLCYSATDARIETRARRKERGEGGR